jgi:hypothetical protein
VSAVVAVMAVASERRSLERLNDVAEKNYELIVLNISELRQVTALSLEKSLMKIAVNK